MSGTQVQTRFRGSTVVVRIRLATQLARNTPGGRLVMLVVDVALIAALSLAVFIGAGIVGNPWYRMVSIEGGSMAPAISRGDLIVIAPAPSKVEPGMILVMTVGDQVVTHRVVAVNADGTLVTRGDANGVNDAWGGRQVRIDGLYVSTIPWLGHILPVGSASEASFADGVGAGMQLTIGPFPRPIGPVPAVIRIVPQTINLTAKGDVTAFIDELTSPSVLSEIDLSLVTLCYAGACIPSDGQAKLDGEVHVAAKFDRIALAGLVGTDRGDLTLVVQGSLIAGGTFSGSDVNHITGGDQATDPGAVVAPTPTPTPTPDLTAAPTSTPTPTPTSDPTLVATPTPETTLTAMPTTTPTLDVPPISTSVPNADPEVTAAP